MSDDSPAMQQPSANPVRENLEASKSHALQAAEELRAAAAAKAGQLRQAAEEHAFQFRDVAAETAQHFRSIAEEQAQQFRDTATDTAGQVREAAGHVRDAAGVGWEEARVKAKELHDETEKYVRANPTKAVLTALGIGFVVGLIFRR